jgi:hypothetical protein
MARTARLGMAGVAALVTSRAVAPPRPAPEAAGRREAAAPARCRCGHDAAAHEHFRPGTDCGACGAQACGRFRARRRGRLRRRA